MVMAGGGTGGHVIPSLAVAAELRALGHEVLFIGTRRGLEATLVPRAGYGIEWIDIGGLQRVGWRKALHSLVLLPLSVVRSLLLLRRHHAAAVFSTGGYVAAPVMLAAIVARIPIVVLEPNAMPGMVTRRLARHVRMALVAFSRSRAFFPPGRCEVTGVPVRREFFDVPPRGPHAVLRVLVTGGSRGARALNRAVREAWPLFASAGPAVHITLQCGPAEYDALATEFNRTGLDGEVVPFIHDMPKAYAEADLVISRAGAGALAELAAAGKPSILVPFPYATDNHQLHNAEAMAEAGAARLLVESECSGAQLRAMVAEFYAQPDLLARMSSAARALARPDAARRAAGLLVEYGCKAV